MNAPSGRRAGWWCAGVSVTLLVAGCRTPSRIPLDPLPMRAAVEIVNRNASRIPGTLRAVGPVDGRVTTSDGQTRSFHADAVLFFLAPRFVRMEVKSFGQRQFLLGANEQRYWFFSSEQDGFECRSYDDGLSLSDDVPIRPDHLIDALGLRPIDLSPGATIGAEPGSRVRTLQRVVADYQQILSVEYDDGDGVVSIREYWLDRAEPRLIRRVIVRDPDGRVVMESQLGDYAPTGGVGAVLPHDLALRWPMSGLAMRFRVRRWRVYPGVGPDSIQFATPPPCAGD